MRTKNSVREETGLKSNSSCGRNRKPLSDSSGGGKKKSLKGLNMNNPGFQPGDEMRTKNSVRVETGLKSNSSCGRNRKPPSDSLGGGKKEKKPERLEYE
jgi:hypothetical protein